MATGSGEEGAGGAGEFCVEALADVGLEDVAGADVLDGASDGIFDFVAGLFGSKSGKGVVAVGTGCD